MNLIAEDCIKKLCVAVISSYLTTLFAKPLECYKKGCANVRRCLKSEEAICKEQNFLKIKRFFAEHEEDVKFWFIGADKIQLFEVTKELYKECNCLADVRKKLKIKKEETIQGFNTRKVFIYKVYDKKDNQLLFKSKRMKEIAEKLNASIGAVNDTILGKNTYLQSDYIIKKEIV